MSNRKKFIRSGAIIPKGVLLIGPPGCGKTQLARAVAGETNLAFYQVTASDFVQPLVGEGSRLIRDLFKQARSHKKGCIIFIDEIDSFSNRSKSFTMLNSNLNQLLTEMDGFKSSENILIIAATNREQALDKALTRSGRFDLKIRIKLPTLDNRNKLLDYFIKKIKFDEKLDKNLIARKTVGFSPAEIKNLVNLAMMNSIKEKKFLADQVDFNFAFERMKLGVKSKQFMKSKEIREIVALREAAKALIVHNENKLPDIDKISIFSFGSSNVGKSIFLEKSDKTNYTKEELLLRIEMLLTTKATEEIFLKDENRTSLAQKDLKKAFSLATRYLSELGMDEKFTLVSLQKEYISSQMKNEIEKKAKIILKERYDKIKHKIERYKQEIEFIKDVLLDKEELDRKEFIKQLDIFNKDKIMPDN